MKDPLSTDLRSIPWRCRLFGHRWKPTHRLERTQPYGLRGWVYIDDVCTRCYKTEWRIGEWAKERCDVRS